MPENAQRTEQKTVNKEARNTVDPAVEELNRIVE